jgi:hypothetical protein
MGQIAWRSGTLYVACIGDVLLQLQRCVMASISRASADGVYALPNVDNAPQPIQPQV